MSDKEIVQYRLAQLNIGGLRYPRDAPQLQGFIAALDPLNQVADTWPGFIWKHDNDETISIASEIFGSEVAANLSVWRDVESLRGFMECPQHATVMKRRRDWFVPIDQATLVLWWVRDSHIPDFMEGQERLTELRRCGPSLAAFDLDAIFPPPDYG